MQTLPKVVSYFPDLSSKQLKLLTDYSSLLLESNQRLNLISRKDTMHFETHHILHSLSIAKFKSFEKDDQVLDVGTGGGLPGIPLAILFPSTHFTLVDALEKKINQVQWMTEQLQLKNVKAVHGRVEKLNQTFDYIVSRAVTQMPKLIAWSRKLMNSQNPGNGMIMLKGGNIKEEASTIKYPLIIKPISDYYEESFFQNKYIIYLKNSANN